MSSSEIFEMCHGDIFVLKPIYEDDKINIIKKYNLNPKYFYHVENKLYKYCYLHDMVMVELYDFSDCYFETFQVYETIIYREETIKSYLEKKNFKGLFFLIDKPYRFKWFEKLYNLIPDEEKYEIFIDIYNSSEYGFSLLNPHFVREVFDKRPSKQFDELEDEIIIYRGEGRKSTEYHKAYSWSTDKEVAKFFSNRFGDCGRVYQAKVKKSNIIDYLTHRNEKEIIVLPTDIYDVKIYRD